VRKTGELIVMEALEVITNLSHEFGTLRYVVGGGGNSSVKDADTVWVKPSGTTLADITPQKFVAIDRKKLSALYEADVPEETNAREAMAKDLVMASVRPESSGRPSVEAPLHETFSAKFVVHTHPPIFNGMTCAKDGAEVCARLFPEALWLEFIDPGYTLCKRVRQEIIDFRERHGREPHLVALKNHGIFVTGDTPDDIRKAYAHLLDTLSAEYEKLGISTEAKLGPEPSPETVQAMTEKIRAAYNNSDDAAFVSASGTFDCPTGPISPDHVVLSRSYWFAGDPTPEAIAAFEADKGYKPRVIVCEEGAFGVGNTQKVAQLALDMGIDGALVVQLAEAFGGLEYMTERARYFIENWEVESYRSKVME
jgi:rhamnose utilization protein RhaD (predicted bifunctional aldolase and dehydrogenase)